MFIPGYIVTPHDCVSLEVTPGQRTRLPSVIQRVAWHALIDVEASRVAIVDTGVGATFAIAFAEHGEGGLVASRERRF